jgi:hypothetical protein
MTKHVSSTDILDKTSVFNHNNIQLVEPPCGYMYAKDCMPDVHLNISPEIGAALSSDER